METETFVNYNPESRKRTLADQSNGREKKRFDNSAQLPLLKLLVPNYVAGALIGKGGSIISELETRFGCTLRLSPNREHYPGTDERIVVITGEKEKLSELNNVIMEKVQSDQPQKPEMRPRDPSRMQQVKIILTNGAAGLLIGRGGLTIKGIQEQSEAKISIGDRSDASVPGERVLTMFGTMEQRMEACKQIIEKISEEPTNVSNISLKYGSMGGLNAHAHSGSINTHAHSGNNFAYGHSGSNVGPGIPHRQQDDPYSALRGLGSFSNKRSKLKTTVTVKMEVPDILVGSILGKQGQTISEFIQFSGAKIQFSGKNEFAPGTTDRILTISGEMHQTETAYFLVTQKVEQAQSELNNH